MLELEFGGGDVKKKVAAAEAVVTEVEAGASVEREIPSKVDTPVQEAKEVPPEPKPPVSIYEQPKDITSMPDEEDALPSQSPSAPLDHVRASEPTPLKLNIPPTERPRAVSAENLLSDESALSFGDDGSMDITDEEGPLLNPQYPLLKRASVASIESVTRSQVSKTATFYIMNVIDANEAQIKKIEIVRKDSSSSSTASPLNSRSPTTPIPADGLGSPRFFNFPMNPSATISEGSPLDLLVSSGPAPGSEKGSPVRDDVRVSTPIITSISEESDSRSPSPSGSISSHRSSMSRVESSPVEAPEDSPTVRRLMTRPISKMPRPVMGSHISKMRPKDGSLPGQSITVYDEHTIKAKKPPAPESNVDEAEQLERQISSILTTIPANIRLGPLSSSSTSSHHHHERPEPKQHRSVSANVHRPAAKHLTPIDISRPASSLSTTSSGSAPALTLSPAKIDPTAGKAPDADKGIKLYHLTQPGKAQPIKLFVRRVGENGERVMVRVGGGWADLGEYLRQYVEHHGRRAVSDSRFEVHGLSAPNLDRLDSATPPQAGGNGHPHRPHSRQSVRSSSALGMAASNSFSQSTSSASGAAPPVAPDAQDGDDSRPSSEASKRSWHGEEVGLAGPRVRKLELSGEKKVWIEEMMDQAKRLQGTGTVRRVFLKGNAPPTSGAE